MGGQDVITKVLLIRHGETVDNIKGLYAGVRNSVLTSHGVQQASRLGQHFSKQGIKLTHLFSSKLVRAVKTAELIRVAQEDEETVDFRQLECLREQDFGFYEGKPFHARTTGGSKSGKDDHRDKHKDDPEFQDVESKESMKQRCEEFMQQSLQPLLDSHAYSRPRIIAIVSHGILLSTLWKVLLSQQQPESVTIVPEVRSLLGPENSLEHLGGWSNTGYLDLDYIVTAQHAPDDHGTQYVDASVQRLRVNGVNKRDHLNALKRTRGGVGSAKHDDSQRSLDTFFKKPRV